MTFRVALARAGFLLLAITLFQGTTETSAQVSNPAEQIAGAVQAAPSQYREGARVIGFAQNGDMVDIRAGTNDMVCLADNPARDGFNVACYHASLDPFMAMGRRLRKEGTTDAAEIQRLRFGAADAGELEMPEKQAALYVMNGDAYDSETDEVTNGFVRYVLYTPYATAESSGLPTFASGPMQPWLMFPGTAGAHVMITPPNDN